MSDHSDEVTTVEVYRIDRFSNAVWFVRTFYLNQIERARRFVEKETCDRRAFDGDRFVIAYQKQVIYDPESDTPMLLPRCFL